MKNQTIRSAWALLAMAVLCLSVIAQEKKPGDSAAKPAAKKPATDKPAAKKPATGKPESGKPGTGKPDAKPADAKTTAADAAENPVAKAPEIKKTPIDKRQNVLAGKYERLETILFNKATLEAIENPRRASLLRKALQQSQNRLTLEQLKDAASRLRKGEYSTAIGGQKQALTDLQDLLKLLATEDRNDRNKSKQDEIKDQIKEVERLIRLQRSVQGRTQGGEDAKRLAKDQEKVANRTGDLKERIEGNNKSDDEKNGEPKDGKPNDGDKDKDGKPKDGDKDKDGKPKDGKPQDGKPQDGKPQDGKPQDGKPQDGKPQDGKPQDGKPQDGKPQDGKPQDGKPQDGKPQDGKPQDGKPQDGKQQQDSPQKRLKAAEQKMREAQKKLEEAKRDESVEAQEQARQELEKAKAELEEILRQLREEEVGRMLALLESRFRKMLDMQLKVHSQTQKLNAIPTESRSREFDIECGRLSFDERKIETEAEKALLLLKEEGSSIAFPETVEMMREDMAFVAARLANVQVGDTTQGRIEDIIAALEEMLDALKTAQEEQEQRKQQQQQQQSGQQQDPSLVSSLAEFKMIRSLQIRVNKRTTQYSDSLSNADDQVGQAVDEGLVRSLKQLSDRQQRLQVIMRNIVLKRNQ